MKATKIMQDMVEVIQRDFCIGSEVSWGGICRDGSVGCTLVAVLGKEDAQLTERLINATKDSLAIHVGRCRGACLLGNKYVPWVPTQDGFVATLGSGPPKANSCSDMYDRGFCKFGNQCKQLHPNSTITFRFVVMTNALACCA